MSISKERNGTYTVFYSKKDVVSQTTSRTKKRGFRTLKEAKEYERSLSRNASDVSFYALYDEHQKNTDQAEETRLYKDNMIKRYMPGLLTVKYEDVTKAYLLNLRSEISKLDLASKTKNKMIEILKTTTRYANEVYDLDDNGKILKRFPLTKKEFEIWTPEEYFQFEAGLHPEFDDCVPFFRTLFFTGLRKGEARALTVDDLDLEKELLIVNKSIRKYKGSLKAPKTPSGVRKVRLDKNTLKLLKPLKSNEKWLFGDYRPISRDRIDRAFKIGIERSGVKKIRIHDLRHSHASFLIMNGANIVTVSKRLGHSSVNMTMNTYAHILKESENQLVEMLNVASLSPVKNDDVQKSQ